MLASSHANSVSRSIFLSLDVHSRLKNHATRRPFVSSSLAVPRVERCQRRIGDQVFHRRTFQAKAILNDNQMSLAKDFAATKFFRYWIQGAVFLVVLAAIDAAYSGDWSRVGVISKETEDSLKPLIVGLILFHIGCATLAAKIAESKRLSVLPRVLKVLAVGFLAFVETYLADEREEF